MHSGRACECTLANVLAYAHHVLADASTPILAYMVDTVSIVTYWSKLLECHAQTWHPNCFWLELGSRTSDNIPRQCRKHACSWLAVRYRQIRITAARQDIKIGDDLCLSLHHCSQNSGRESSYVQRKRQQANLNMNDLVCHVPCCMLLCVKCRSGP